MAKKRLPWPIPKTTRPTTRWGAILRQGGQDRPGDYRIPPPSARCVFPISPDIKSNLDNLVARQKGAPNLGCRGDGFPRVSNG